MQHLLQQQQTFILVQFTPEYRLTQESIALLQAMTQNALDPKTAASKLRSGCRSHTLVSVHSDDALVIADLLSSLAQGETLVESLLVALGSCSDKQ